MRGEGGGGGGGQSFTLPRPFYVSSERHDKGIE